MEDDPSVTDVAKARYCQLAPPLRLNSDPISRKKDFTSWTSTTSLMNTLLRVYPLNTEEQLKWSDHPLVVGLGSIDSIIKIILWIVKGLGRPKKNSSIKVLLRKYNADIIMVQEPKKHRVDEMCLCSFWSGRNIDYVFSPAEGSAGGMVMVGTLICSRFGMLKSVFSLSLSLISLLGCLIEIPSSRGGFVASMAPPSIWRKRNFGSSLMIWVIWLTGRVVLSGTSMRFFA